ncbi:MAG: family transposase [Polaromonas sp.]|nr:family transposase [Polaromonas sp.]
MPGRARACRASRYARCSLKRVEKRFGAVESVPSSHVLEFLSDNGSAYVAAQTRQMAKSLGLKPINTPVCSPQSNGMAESFVNTFRRDYLSRMDLSDACAVMRQLPAAFASTSMRGIRTRP